MEAKQLVETPRKVRASAVIGSIAACMVVAFGGYYAAAAVGLSAGLATNLYWVIKVLRGLAR